MLIWRWWSLRWCWWWYWQPKGRMRFISGENQAETHCTDCVLGRVSARSPGQHFANGHINSLESQGRVDFLRLWINCGWVGVKSPKLNLNLFDVYMAYFVSVLIFHHKCQQNIQFWTYRRLGQSPKRSTRRYSRGPKNICPVEWQQFCLKMNVSSLRSWLGALKVPFSGTWKWALLAYSRCPKMGLWVIHSKSWILWI